MALLTIHLCSVPAFALENIENYPGSGTVLRRRLKLRDRSGSPSRGPKATINVRSGFLLRVAASNKGDFRINGGMVDLETKLDGKKEKTCPNFALGCIFLGKHRYS